MCSLGEHTSRAPSGIRPAATCFAPNAGPPLWFANLLLIPQSTENFSPPELNGKLLLLLRSSRKPRAASKVAPSAPQLLLPESGSNARIPLVSESQTEPSSSLLSLARSDTAQRIGRIPPQRGGSVVGRRLLHIALCRETQSEWANNGRGTQRKALQECRHHHGHHSHR